MKYSYIGKSCLCLVVLSCTFVKCGSIYNVWGDRGEGYYIEIEIGFPSQKFNVLLDTGSANLAVAAASLPYVEKYFQRNLSRTFKTKGESISITYNQGKWNGLLGSDLVRVPSIQAKRVRCDVALIQESEGFFTNSSKWQGILGLGFPVLAQPLGSSMSWLTALPFPKVFSLQLGCSPLANQSDAYGYLELRKSQISSPLFTAMVIREWFYEVLIVGLWINNKSIDIACNELNNDKSIMDSGTTSLRLPRKVFQETVRLINNTVKAYEVNVSNAFWNQRSSVCIDVNPETVFPKVSIGLARYDGKFFKVVLSPLSYLYREEPSNNQISCYKLAIEASDTGTILGLTFLEGLMVTFDQENRSVLFHSSVCCPPVLLEGPFLSKNDPLDCIHKNKLPGALTAISITMGAFLSVAAVLMAYLACSRFCYQYLCPVKNQWPHRSRSRRELIPRSSDFDLTTVT